MKKITNILVFILGLIVGNIVGQHIADTLGL